jgi:magnesium chelatase family protein
MLSRVTSAATIGLEGVLIEVEVDVASRGFPTFTIVGLPSKAIDEAKDRVRTAIVNTSFEMPESRITVNLAPADIPKSGSAFDIPIAIGILASSGMLEREVLKGSLFVGELSLKGEIRRVPGVISIAIAARAKKILKLYLPAENVPEASLVEGIEIYPIATLEDLILHLNGKQLIEQHHARCELHAESAIEPEYDFADIAGQQQARRALEIAAAGHHNIHLKGPPGAGKTLLSRSFPSIMTPLDSEELLDVTKIYSVAGMITKRHFSRVRPFRAPHHTISRNGLTGGGTNPSPGEISLAHRGVLFLDEFAEFPRFVIEALRQPLEDGFVTISRASGTLTFPSRFLLIAASNPCPCGYLGHPKKQCICMPGMVVRYKKRLSGPILDRIDLHVDVPPVDDDKLASREKSESSTAIRTRVLTASNIQKERFQGLSIKTNSQMSSAHIKKFCTMSEDAEHILKTAISTFNLSARSYFKVIKIARTIADLEGSVHIETEHIAESLQYRVKEES